VLIALYENDTPFERVVPANPDCARETRLRDRAYCVRKTNG
jgi:hypothetical protein